MSIGGERTGKISRDSGFDETVLSMPAIPVVTMKSSPGKSVYLGIVNWFYGHDFQSSRQISIDWYLRPEFSISLICLMVITFYAKLLKSCMIELLVHYNKYISMNISTCYGG